MSETFKQLEGRIRKEVMERQALVSRMPFLLRQAHSALWHAEVRCADAAGSVECRRSWYRVACYDKSTMQTIRRGVHRNAKYAVAQAAFALGLLGLAKGSS